MALQETGAAEKWWDMRVLFSTRANRWRMALGALSESVLTWVKFADSCSVGVWGQTIGPSNAYFAVLLKVAGVNDLARQRLLNFINTQVILFWACEVSTDE